MLAKAENRHHIFRCDGYYHDNVYHSITFSIRFGFSMSQMSTFPKYFFLKIFLFLFKFFFYAFYTCFVETGVSLHFCGSAVTAIVWSFDLHLPMQSVLIITKAVNLIHTDDEVYSIYNFP